MMYYGDFATGKTVVMPFHTFNASGASVTLTGLAVGDVKIYKGTSMTERSSTAGITLLDTDGIDLDTRTGIHGISIDTSDNTDAGFYAAGNEYFVYIDSVTVDAQTVRFYLGSFSIERSGGVLELAKGASGFSAIKTQTAAIEVDTADIQSRIPAALVSGRIDASVGAMAANVLTASAIATDAITSNKIAADAIAAGKIAAGAITAAKFAAGAIDAAALAADAVTEIQSGLATAAALQTVDDFLDTEVAAIKAVTDKLDTALELDGAVYRFTTNALEQGPSGGSSALHSGTAQAGAASSITLNAGASAVNDTYVGCIVAITGGTGAGQSNFATDYDGTTKVLTVQRAWATIPDNTSTFDILPLGAALAEVQDIVDGVWGALRADYTAVGTMGEYLNVNVKLIDDDAAAASLLESYVDGTSLLPVNVMEINSVGVTGSGTTADPWQGNP